MSEDNASEEIKAIVQELQIIRGQIQSFSSQSSEYGLTIDALSNQDKDKAVYRSLGNLLLEVEDREKLSNELSESKINVENHLKRLIEREGSLREKYEHLASIFESQ
ncbi:MAG: prefoldin subunit [Candidatus Poseidoniales archaeon]|jgi:chaperonin cofactor prefoldin|tara:strand:+ start:761 stop:1081 length:321 start_codon:yes stop_codon:yes gene_type:complete